MVNKNYEINLDTSVLKTGEFQNNSDMFTLPESHVIVGGGTSNTNYPTVDKPVSDTPTESTIITRPGKYTEGDDDVLNIITEVFTFSPTNKPTLEPTYIAPTEVIITVDPTFTVKPTSEPTSGPTVIPTTKPYPTVNPTILPTITPPTVPPTNKPIDPIIDPSEIIDPNIGGGGDFDDIDNPYIDPNTNTIYKYDELLGKYIALEELNKSISYWTDAIEQKYKDQSTYLNYYKQKESNKVFNCCTYSIDNSYISSIYEDMYKSFANVRKFNEDSEALIRGFNEYISEDTTPVIVFEDLKENAVNIINTTYTGDITYSEDPLNIYLKTIQVTNTDLYFKTSDNVHIDYDGVLRFSDEKTGTITAYSTANPSINKTVYVRPNRVEYIAGEQEIDDTFTLPRNIVLTTYLNAFSKTVPGVSITLANGLQISDSVVSLVPASFGSFTGSQIVDIKKNNITLNSSYNYTCKIYEYNSKAIEFSNNVPTISTKDVVPSRTNFTTPIFSSNFRTTLSNLVYGNVSVIDETHLKLDITMNTLSMLYDTSVSFLRKYTIEIYNHTDDSVEQVIAFHANFEGIVKDPKTPVRKLPAKRLANTMQIKGPKDTEYVYLNRYIKNGYPVNPNETYQLCIPDNASRYVISSINVYNGSGTLSTIVPKIKLDGPNTAKLYALGRGSFVIDCVVFDKEAGSYIKFINKITVNNYSIKHGDDLLELTPTQNYGLTISLNKSYSHTCLAPVTIIAQYNSYAEKIDGMISEYQIKSFNTNYEYDNPHNETNMGTWATISATRDNGINGIIPVRIYWVNYDNTIFYKDTSLTKNDPIKKSKSFRMGSEMIDYLGNEYGKHLEQPLYSVDVVKKLSPFMKISLALSQTDFKDGNIGPVRMTMPPRIYYSQFTTDVLSKINGSQLTNTQAKQILAIEAKDYEYSYLMEQAVDEYLASQGFDVLTGIYRPDTLAEVTRLKESNKTVNSSITTEVLNTPIYGFADVPDDEDDIVIWNVIPNIKISNPTIKHTITENYGNVRNGCIYRQNEKNFDIVMDKNALFDTSHRDAFIEVDITENDKIYINFNLSETNVITKGKLETVYLIDEDSIYVNGKLEGTPLKLKYSKNCDRDNGTGKIDITTLSSNSSSISMVLSALNTNKRVSLTFTFDNYNVVTDNLVIDNTYRSGNSYLSYVQYELGDSLALPIDELYPKSKEELNKDKYITDDEYVTDDKYNELVKTSILYNLTYSNPLKDVWVETSSLFDGDKHPMFKYNLASSSPVTEITNESNLYAFITLTNKTMNTGSEVTRKDLVAEIKYITNSKPEFKSETFVQPVVRTPLDINSVTLSDNLYNSLFANANNMPIDKDYEYTLCFDSQKILQNVGILKKGTSYIFSTKQVTPKIEYAVSKGINYIYDASISNQRALTKLVDVKLNVHILCKNKLIVIERNLNIASSFKFCYNKYFKIYGHINGLVITDCNNNLLQTFRLDTAFLPLTKANTLLKRIYDTPVMFFDDASSEIKSNADYDNLLPSFTYYRNSLNGTETVPNKLGYLSKMTYTQLANDKTTLAISNKVVPVIAEVSNNKNSNAYLTLIGNAIENDKLVKKYFVPVAYHTVSTSVNIAYSYDSITSTYIGHTLSNRELTDKEVDAIEKQTGLTVNQRELVSNVLPKSIRHIGYMMYYYNLAWLKKLNWNKLSDSEDIIYYLILLDKLSNSSEGFYEFKKSLNDFNGINKVSLFDGEGLFKLPIEYVTFFERNYETIIKPWKERIEAYEILEDVLSAYDPSLNITKQIDAYLKKLKWRGNKNKAEKIYYILTEKTTNKFSHTGWAVSQINNRIWDSTAIHYIWKNVFNILFDGVIDITNINDAILRDIYNYGFYPILNVPKIDEYDGVYTPFVLNYDGTITESRDTDGNLVWNGSQVPIYKYVINDKNQIGGLTRTFKLATPIDKTWDVTKQPSVHAIDKYGNSFNDYNVIDADENGWGTLKCKGIEYTLNIKGDIVLRNTSKDRNTKILHRKNILYYIDVDITNVLNDWHDNFYYYDENNVVTSLDYVKENYLTELQNLPATTTNNVIKYNPITDKYYNITKKNDNEYDDNDAYVEVNGKFVQDNWKNDVYYNNTLAKVESINDVLSINHYFIKCDLYKTSTKFKQVALIRIERKIGETKEIVITAKDDISQIWIDEDRCNIVKMEKRNLLEAIRVQKFLAQLFISELTKTTYMIDAITKYRKIKTVVDDVNEKWNNINDLSKQKLINQDYMRLLDFNITGFAPIYNCIYPDDKYFRGIYTYAYQYYDGYYHQVKELTGYSDIAIQLPKTTSLIKYNERYNINDDLLSLHLTVPQNNVTSSPTAQISRGFLKYNDREFAYVLVTPVGNVESIEPFGIYPWNVNKQLVNINGKDKYEAAPINWTTSAEDLAGLINYRDYEAIAKYKEIDPDGHKNSMIVSGRVMSADMLDAPAILAAYNYYPEEWIGISGKYSYFAYTYAYDENEKSYKTTSGIYNLSQKELNVHPLNCAYENYLSYTYVITSYSTYILTYEYVTFNNYAEFTFCDRPRQNIITSISGVDKISNKPISGRLITTSNGFVLNKLSGNTTFNLIGESSTLEDALAIVPASNNDNKDIASSNVRTYLANISFSYMHVNDSCDLNMNFSSEDNTGKLANDKMPEIVNSLEKINRIAASELISSYAISKRYDEPLVTYTLNNTFEFKSLTKSFDELVHKKFGFFLGTISQWQLVQDNVREINAYLAYCYSYINNKYELLKEIYNSYIVDTENDQKKWSEQPYKYYTCDFTEKEIDEATYTSLSSAKKWTVITYSYYTYSVLNIEKTDELKTGGWFVISKEYYVARYPICNRIDYIAYTTSEKTKVNRGNSYYELNGKPETYVLTKDMYDVFAKYSYNLQANMTLEVKDKYTYYKFKADTSSKIKNISSATYNDYISKGITVWSEPQTHYYTYEYGESIEIDEVTYLAYNEMSTYTWSVKSTETHYYVDRIHCKLDNFTPDFFYDGRIDRNKPDGKIFWTSSEMDNVNSNIMFFDEYTIQNNLKNTGAYVRPFIKVDKPKNNETGTEPGSSTEEETE